METRNNPNNSKQKKKGNVQSKLFTIQNQPPCATTVLQLVPFCLAFHPPNSNPHRFLCSQKPQIEEDDVVIPPNPKISNSFDSSSIGTFKVDPFHPFASISQKRLLF